jgi:hypothetical protein
MTEPFFYGGYPQQAALAFGIFGVFGLVGVIRAGGLRGQTLAFAVAAAGFLLASASHLLFGPLLLASGALVVLSAGAVPRDRRQFLLLAAAALTPAAACSAFVALAYIRDGYSAPLAASQRTIGEAWAYATRESPGFWAPVVIGGIVASGIFLLRYMSSGRRYRATSVVPDAVVVGFALVVPSGIFLIASGQPRLAPPLLLGGAILLAHTCRESARALEKLLPASLLIWGIAIVWLSVTSTGFAREFGGYYQVLDASLVAAVQSIPPAKTGSIAVAADRRGWPIGWWVEAMQVRPVFTGSDLQWLAFPEEQRRAGATALLLASPDGRVLRERADAMGVRFLVLRKWDWIGWDRWVDGSAQAPAIIYDDDETLVLAIFPDHP